MASRRRQPPWLRYTTKDWARLSEPTFRRRLAQAETAYENGGRGYRTTAVERAAFWGGDEAERRAGLVVSRLYAAGRAGRKPSRSDIVAVRGASRSGVRQGYYSAYAYGQDWDSIKSWSDKQRAKKASRKRRKAAIVKFLKHPRVRLVKSSRVASVGYDRNKHPRYPKGHPKGGQFMPKGGRK